MKSYLLILFLITASLQIVKSQTYEADWKSLDSRPVPGWFSKAKFGIFIHWGVYSVPAWAPADIDVGNHTGLKYSEWYWDQLIHQNPNFVQHHAKTYGDKVKYQDFAAQFKAENFDPDYWAKIFKDAGAKYVVLTSKHHEGFTLWPSKNSWNWNAYDIGPHRDLLGDLTKSVKNAGLKMGYYYSLLEWFNPLYKTNLTKYVDDHMIPQMKDLVETYQPDVLWTDGEWDHPSTQFKSQEFLAWLYNQSSVKDQVVVNDRWGQETRSKHGGIFTTEYGSVDEQKTLGDQLMEHPWEECRAIGTSFGYNQMENLSNYLTSERLIHLLIEKVSHGGNLLLDVGPTADGRIPVIMQQRLKDIGDWLRLNGEAIYDTQSARQYAAKTEPDVSYTKKGNALYVICTKWPQKKITVQGVNTLTKVTLLGSSEKVKYRVSGNKLEIEVPKINPGTSPCDHAWVFKVDGLAK